MIQLIPPADVLARNDEALLLYEGQLLRLNAIATAVVSLAKSGIEVGDLVVALEERFGNPATVTAAEATRRVVNDLVQRGVLRWAESETETDPEPPSTPADRSS